MEEMMSLVANFGFPIALSVYLLTRLGAKMDSLSVSIKRLSISMDKMIRCEGDESRIKYRVLNEYGGSSGKER